jgi:hypothetical protein
MQLFWLPQPVRFASVCSLQSVGEIQSGAAGYQTDIRHTRTSEEARGQN